MAAGDRQGLEIMGVSARVCVSGGTRAPALGNGFVDLGDFPMKWCQRKWAGKVAEFVRGVAYALRSQGVLLYCTHGADCGGAAMVAVLCHLTNRSVDECAAYVCRLRKIVDVSKLTPALRS